MNSRPNSEKSIDILENVELLNSLTINGSNLENKIPATLLNNVTDGKNEGEVHSYPSNRQPLPKGFSETMTSVDDDVYSMNHKRRGHCLVFNHHTFDKKTGLNERSGTNKDRDSVKRLFTYLGFTVTVFDNLNVKQIHEKLEYFALEEDHADNDCFAIVFMSHGEHGCLFGNDSTFQSDKLYSRFTADYCPSLAGKPKMFFIQACRGESLDSGHTLVHRSRDEMDAGSFSMYKIPAHADFLICWSTVPGYFSWRNTSNGSWFIQSLVNVFSREAKTKDVLSMMTSVNRHMILNFESNCPSSVGMHKKKQTACTISSLMRRIFITPPSDQ